MHRLHIVKAVTEGGGGVRMKDVCLDVRSVTQVFRGGLTAVRNVSFQIPRGAFVSLLGPSGCGKSTLFNIIAGLMTPTGGDVQLNGASVIGQTGRVGYMLQKDLLLPWRTIEDNITISQTLHGVPRRKARRECHALLARCGLEGFAHARPHELSGGMRQRAALMRTLMTGREVLLLDEPFGALDAITRLQLQMLLCDIWQETGKTILLVTHDVDEALLLSDEIIVMSERPGTVRERLTVPHPRPRRPESLAEPDMAALMAKLMELLMQGSPEGEAVEA